MADLVIFRYLHRDSALHQLDGRIKLASVVLFSVAAGFASTPVDFVLLTLVLFTALIGARLPVATLAAELRYFSLILVPVIIVQAFSIPGVPLTVGPVSGLTVEGLQSGLYFAWRIVVMVLAGVLLTGTTPLSTIGHAVEWFLRPVRFVPATRIATMINLTFVFVPLVYEQASAMTAAQKARCVEVRQNPVKRVTFLALPLLMQTFRRADEMVLAMESRCYSEDRTPAVFTAKAPDWLALAGSILVVSMVIVSPF